MNHEFPINHAAAIARFRITNAHVLHFCITNAEEWGWEGMSQLSFDYLIIISKL